MSSCNAAVFLRVNFIFLAFHAWEKQLTCKSTPPYFICNACWHVRPFCPCCVIEPTHWPKLTSCNTSFSVWRSPQIPRDARLGMRTDGRRATPKRIRVEVESRDRSRQRIDRRLMRTSRSATCGRLRGVVAQNVPTPGRYKDRKNKLSVR